MKNEAVEAAFFFEDKKFTTELLQECVNNTISLWDTMKEEIYGLKEKYKKHSFKDANRVTAVRKDKSGEESAGTEKLEPSSSGTEECSVGNTRIPIPNFAHKALTATNALMDALGR